MNHEDDWKQFMTSGSVKDYLTYVAKMEESNRKSATFHVPGETEEQSILRERFAGEYPYAGFYNGDRNGDKPDSYR